MHPLLILKSLEFFLKKNNRLSILIKKKKALKLYVQLTLQEEKRGINVEKKSLIIKHPFSLFFSFLFQGINTQMTLRLWDTKCL